MNDTPSRLRALLDAATPLPWGGGGSMRVNMPLSGEVWCSIVWGQKTPTMEFDIAYMPKDFERTQANLSLIVAAVNALPSLLAQAERVAELEAERSKMELALREVTDRWCVTTDEYIAELRRIYAEYKRLDNAEVTRQRAALGGGR